MLPVISVIMPVYNQALYVADAIRCILQQTYSNFEFIIVDDGSTDKTVQIVESFRDERIRLIRTEHKGFIEALKLATAEAKGKWLARMDSDDICPPDRFQKQLSFLDAHPECVFVSTGYGVVTLGRKFLAPHDSSKWHYLKPLDITRSTYLFADPSTVYDRQLALDAGYDDEWQNEKPLWYKLLKQGKGVVMEETLYYSRWRIGSLSRGLLGNKGERLNFDVRAKYDPQNIALDGYRSDENISLKNETRCVYFYTAAGDYRAALATAFKTWQKYPFLLQSIKLVLVSLGVRRPKEVYGPCQIKFISVSPPC